MKHIEILNYEQCYILSNWSILLLAYLIRVTMQHINKYDDGWTIRYQELPA